MPTKLLALALLALALFGGCASHTISGKILVKGHLPHSYVALKVNSRLYYNIVGRYSRLLRASYQGKKVTLEGKIVAKALGLGMPARFEATRIVKVEKRR